jgi:hypothetical protein
MWEKYIKLLRRFQVHGLYFHPPTPKTSWQQRMVHIH